MAEILAGRKLISKFGGALPPSAASSLRTKIVLLYFSASWCGPCHQFTPMLKLFHSELKRAGANVEVVYGEYTDPRLPDGSVDLAMTCLTYHHIEDRVRYFSRLQADLAPGGRVVHLDDRSDLDAPLRWLPTSGHTSDPDEMDAEMQSAGYRRTRTFDLLLVQTFREYAPRGDGLANAAGPER